MRRPDSSLWKGEESRARPSVPFSNGLDILPARIPRGYARPRRPSRSGRSQAVRLPKEFRLEGREAGIRRRGAAVVLEPAASDRRWLDDVAGAFPEGFFAEGRERPELPPAPASRCR